MQITKKRWMAGLLASVATLTLAGAAAFAAPPGAPWFQLNGGVANGLATPLRMVAGYVPFWLYAEGQAWAQYLEMKAAQTGLPAIYLARSGAPLPTLPAGGEPEPAAEAMERAPRPLQWPALQADPAPAPQPAPVPAPQPAPAPAPQPAPVPAPQPAPVPAPQPAPAPAPQPAPAPAPPPGEPAPAPVQPDPVPGLSMPDAGLAPAAGVSAAEQRLVGLVNEARAAAGLAPLSIDLRLVATARAKSRDMIAGGYFDHDSPTLGSPFNQIRSAGIAYRTAAENLAGNQTVEAAHRALMNSPGHRENILSASFNRVGIGIVAGGPYGLMVTQQFIGQ